MKYLVTAAALAIASPAFAQAAPAAGHQGHDQHQQNGQHQQHGQHQPGQEHGDCCADRNGNGRMDCCERMEAGQSGGSAPAPQPQGHSGH